MSAVLELSHLVKDYRGLRPLRVDRFVLSDLDQTAIVGLDRPAAETLINLITGAALPDSGKFACSADGPRTSRTAPTG